MFDSAMWGNRPKDSEIQEYLNKKYNDSFSVKDWGKGANSSTAYCVSGTYPGDVFHVVLPDSGEGDGLSDDYQLVLATHSFASQLEQAVHKYFPGAEVIWELSALGHEIDSEYCPGDAFEVLEGGRVESVGGDMVPENMITSSIQLVDKDFAAISEEDLQAKGLEIIKDLRDAGLISNTKLGNYLFFSLNKNDLRDKPLSNTPCLMWDTDEYTTSSGLQGVRYMGWKNKEDYTDE